MGEGSRCGSVTDLLQSSVDLYVPPSPRHHPPPDPDCWGDPGRTLKHEKDKCADTVQNDPSSVGETLKITKVQATDQQDERPKSGGQTQNSSQVSDAKISAQSKAEAEVKTVKEKNKPSMKPRKPKPGPGPDQTKSRGAATEKGRPVTKSDKTTLQGHKTAGRGVQGTGEDSSLPQPTKLRCGE